MRYLRKSSVAALLGLALVLLACTATSTPFPANTALPSAAPQSTPAPTSEPEMPAPTATPKQPPSPRPALTPTPTALPAPTPTTAPASTSTSIAIPTAEPVVSVAPQGKPSGTLRVAGTADIPHRDVHQSVQEMMTSLGPGLAYSRLLRLRSGPDLDQPSLRLECDLCQSWRLTDGLVYEFQLRPEVRWHNIPPVGGRLLVADDLVFYHAKAVGIDDERLVPLLGPRPGSGSPV